jgi:hypothetical protein
MPFCAPDELAELWSAAGLLDVGVTAAVVTGTYEGFGDLWEPLDHGVGPSGAYVAALPADQRAAVREELRRRLDVADTAFELTARAWIVTGRVR